MTQLILNVPEHVKAVLFRTQGWN